MATGTNQKRRPISLKAGGTAALRRVIAGATATSAVPTLGSDGEPSGGAKRVHAVLKHDGVTVSYRVWLRLDFSGEWVLHPTLGTVAVALADSPKYMPFDVDAADRVYVQITTATGPFAGGIDVWLGGNSL